MKRKREWILRRIWESHNFRRNLAHADYGNPMYVRNRIQSDDDWINDRDKILKMFIEDVETA